MSDGNFREPAVRWSEQLASLLPLSLIAPEPRHAHCCAEFPGFGFRLVRSPLVKIEFGAHRRVPLQHRLLRCQLLSDHCR